MISVKEAIVVEGRYDKSKLSSFIDGVIVETKGFGVFKDDDLTEYLRRLADERGLIVLTDSDGAGFLIRSRISSCIPKEKLKHAYVPDISGKEKRKAKPSKEGTLGVEGMEREVIIEALRRCGATVNDENVERKREEITKTDFYELGLSGKKDSGEKRRALARKLNLPQRLSANGLLQAVNGLYSRDEFISLADKGTGGYFDGTE